MKTCPLIIAAAVALFASPLALATQADDVTVAITGQTPGATPFLSQLTLSVSDTTLLRSVSFTIAPRPVSVTRPLSATYSHDYLLNRGDLDPSTQQIFLPVFGLYDGYNNTVTLTYIFLDGSLKQDATTITTAVFDDQGCGYKNPVAIQPRSRSTSLSYDYIFIRSGCGNYSPIIIDSDRFVRWVSTFATPNALFAASTFFHNAAYVTLGSAVSKVELDGTITPVGDYRSIGVHNLHHNIDSGKTGIIIEADTDDYFESVFYEINPDDGGIIKSWSMGDIISAAMVAGGDDPNQFVFPTPMDWFHNNAVTYNRADDSLIVSSRENFVVAIDYETSAIKWIFGDPTKKWHEFPSLAKFALDVAPGTLVPIGQHATSLTFDQNLLLFDDGLNSLFQTPPGVLRTYASPRKYQIDLNANLATELWNFERNASVFDPICSSVYEDAPFNYLIDYAFIGGFGAAANFAQILGVDVAGNTVFNYQYPTVVCNTAYNALPIHLENTIFPTIGAKALNISTRGLVGVGDDALINGFIVTGAAAKKVALRVLGPSLNNAGLSGLLADPTLTLYDSSGGVVATNDNWATDAAAADLSAVGLAPTDTTEAATVQTLTPGSYTIVARGKDATSGLGLVEVYDLSPEVFSELGNISARGTVGPGDDTLISGFIVGDVANATVIIRALGPSLASNVPNAIADPAFNIFDGNGVLIAGNNNWKDDVNSPAVEKNGLAPAFDAEAALVLHPPPGAYSVVVQGDNGGAGIGLLEVYNLDATTGALEARQ